MSSEIQHPLSEELNISSDDLIDVADCDICSPPITKEENQQEPPDLDDVPQEDASLERLESVGRRGRSPRIPSDDEEFMPRRSSTITLSRPTSRGPANRTRSKSRTASIKPVKSRERSKSRKSTRGSKRAASRSRSRRASTSRKPAARGRDRN